MSIYTQTEGGNAIITHPELVTLSESNEQHGSIALGVLIADNPENFCWCRFFEWGGDWQTFGDAQRDNPGDLMDWMPDAVESAVDAAYRANPAAEADMEWFALWARDARQTINLHEDRG